MAILVVGSIAFDTIKTPTGQAEMALGGSALHFSAAASFFAPVRVVGVVGNDFPHDRIIFLKERQTDLSGIETMPGKTFHWKGEYTQDWNNAITHDTQLNVFEKFSPRIPAAFQKSEFVFLANIHPALQLQVLNQIETPVFTALDTMNFWIEGAREALLDVIKKVDLLLLNDSEARLLSKRGNLLDAAEEIFKMGPRALIIKKGEHGALLFNGDKLFAFPAYPLQAIVDPTGAGDSFAGGFMGYLAQHNRTDDATMRLAIAYGSVLASFNVTNFSFDRLRALRRDDIDSRFQAFRELTRF